MRLLLVFFVTLFSKNILAQDFNVFVYTSNEGLPITSLSSVRFDSLGYLWMGTPSGFARFDGRFFSNYSIREGLRENNAGIIFEDSRHQIWSCTNNILYRFSKNRFTPVPVASPKPLEYLYSISELHDGKIVFSCEAGMFVFIDSMFVPYSLYGLPSKTVLRTILKLPGNKIIANTTDAVYEKTGDADWKILFERTGNKMSPIYYTVANRGRVFFNTEDAVYEIIDNQNVRKVFNEPQKKSQLIHFFFDSKDNLWISTAGSSIYVQQPGGAVKNFGKEYGIDNYPMSEIVEDKWGNIWVASYQGLIRFTPSFINSVFSPLNNNERLFRNIYKTSRYIYFLGGQKCISRFHDLNENPFPASVEKKIKAELTYKQIIGITGSPDETIWVCTSFGEFYEISDRGFRKIQLPVTVSAAAYVNGKLLAGRKNTFYELNTDSLALKNKRAEGFEFNWPEKVLVDSNMVWFTDNNKLMMHTGDSIINFSSRLNLSPDTYFYLLKHGQDLWIATSKQGILRIRKLKDRNYKILPALNRDNGLMNEQVLSIAFDGNDDFWYTTTKGLWKAELTFHNDSVSIISSKKISKAEGLHNTIWDSGPLMTGFDGSIFVGTTDGVFRINVAAIPRDTLPPVVQIENVELTSGNAWQSFTSRFSTYQNLPQNPRLPYKQNSLTFYFNGITMSHPEEVKFKYRLDGYDKQWSQITGNRMTTYTNLPAGKYTFNVMAVNADGIWSPLPESFEFSIQPPFWQTLPFRLAIALLLISATYYFIRRREKIKQEKNKIELQIAELRLQTLQSQMNPHFIFNSLNSVEKYILENNPTAGARYLSKFSKLIRRILDNSSHNLLPLHQIIDTLKMYVELEALRFNREFNYDFNLLDEEDEAMNLRLPPMLLQPFVENAIWHGLMPKEGEKRLLITIQKNEDTLFCMVEDNGVGRPDVKHTKDSHISRGEKMTHGMMDSLQQLLNSKAQIKISDLRNETGKTRGTRVEIYIPIHQKNIENG